jgi:hypothetical protein
MLSAYSGFGGIKAVLNPVGKPEDTQHWTKTDRELYLLIKELHMVLRRGAGSKAEYSRYVSSLKNSVLSAFYTLSNSHQWNCRLSILIPAQGRTVFRILLLIRKY